MLAHLDHIHAIPLVMLCDIYHYSLWILFYAFATKSQYRVQQYTESSRRFADASIDVQSNIVTYENRTDAQLNTGTGFSHTNEFECHAHMLKTAFGELLVREVSLWDTVLRDRVTRPFLVIFHPLL